MIAILEKSEHNVNFHPIVDFVEASHIRIKTTNEGTKILATVDGKSKTIYESSIRKNLKLNDEEGISTLPDAELLENLALMGYNILPNQKFIFQKGQDRENIIKTSALPYDSTPRVTSLDADEGKLSGDDAPIKGMSIEIGEEAGVEKSTERRTVSVPHVAEVSIVGVPTGSGLVPTVSTIFTTASVVTPYSRCPREISAKDKDHHAKILKYQAQQSKPLSKKEQMEVYMSVLRSHSRWKTKHFRGMTLVEIKENFIPVWKQIEDFILMASKEEGERVKRKGLKLEQGSVKKMKTSEDVSEEDLKEMMQLVPVEEVYVEALQVKHLIIDWEIHTEGKRDYWKIIRLGGHTTVYQFFMDMLKKFNREDLNQLWTLVKETLSIRQASSDKEKELWVKLKRLFKSDFEDKLWTHTQALMHDPVEWRLYDTCGVHHVFTRDQEIFMLVERDYPLEKRTSYCDDKQ
uniref:Uncharacterized protein n=1 Tax=Tanacetum cinerariifolium TaxID=118510 RepID=A0A6L2N2S1_TANCI|nr:hypothetical protein [Tanacetum cinerariifolium]